MAYIDKLLNKFNKAKSAINTIKGIQSRIQSINYTSAIDALGIETKQAEEYIDARRVKLEDQLKTSNTSKTYAGKTPTGKQSQLIYPYHDRLENYILFNIRPRRGRGGFHNHPVHKSRSIAMYVPDAVISQAAVQYRNEGINSFSRGASDLMGSMVTAMTDPSKDFFNAENGDVVKRMATKAIQNAANTMTGGLSNLKFGRASNPMQEQMLDGIPFRSWDFTFDFWPKSREEADEVNNIIYTFRTSMLPDAYGENFDFTEEKVTASNQEKILVLGRGKEETIDGDTNAAYFNYPNVFEISFEGSMKNKVDGFLPAVCTNAQVDYTGGQKFSTFHDGQPIHIQLTLNFLEIKTMTLGNYESLANSGLVQGEGYFTQGSTVDGMSKGEFSEEEHLASNSLKKLLPKDHQGDPTKTHKNNKGFVYKDTIDPKS